MSVPDAPDDAVDSRWWYLIAAVPLYTVVGTIGGIAAALAVISNLPDPETIEAGNEPPLLDVIPAELLAIIILLALVGLLVTLLAPVAFYFDAGAVADAALDWEPDPVLWGVVGVAGIFFTPLQVGGALYYLYHRHKKVGTP